jgi:hypothetical protein
VKYILREKLICFLKNAEYKIIGYSALKKMEIRFVDVRLKAAKPFLSSAAFLLFFFFFQSAVY